MLPLWESKPYSPQLLSTARYQIANNRVMRGVNGEPKCFKEYRDSLIARARELKRQEIIAFGIR